MVSETASGLHRCEEIARRGHGSSEHHYCHWLPRGHTGPCEPFPTAERMGQEWYRALQERLAWKRAAAEVPA